MHVSYTVSQIQTNENNLFQTLHLLMSNLARYQIQTMSLKEFFMT